MSALNEDIEDRKPFRFDKFINAGTFSYVYSVKSEHEHDKEESYALKRYLLREPEVLLLAQREYKFLKRLNQDPHKPPFFPTLYYAFAIDVSPTFVFSIEYGTSLADALGYHGPFKIEHARFFICEVICALAYLHSKEIVHLDLRLSNLMFSTWGHIQLIGFERAYDLIENRGMRPKNIDFSVPCYYAAPEVAKRQTISTKADIWSLGVVMATLMGRNIRTGRRKYLYTLAKRGYWHIKRFSKLRRSLRSFFLALLDYNHENRPSIEEVKNLDFFKTINWEIVEARSYAPPFVKPWIWRLVYDFNPVPSGVKEALADSMYKRRLPKKRDHFVTASNFDVLYEGPDMRRVRRIGMTETEAINAIREFNYIHPCLSFQRAKLKGTVTDEYVQR